MKLHWFKQSLLQMVDEYESLNVVYQSDGHPISFYSVVLEFCSKVSGRLGNGVCRTSCSAVRVS